MCDNQQLEETDRNRTTRCMIHACTGTLIDPEYVQDELSPYCSGTFYGKLCKQCAPCNGTVQSMTREQQSEYKYQVSIEGYGPTADAIYVRSGDRNCIQQCIHLPTHTVETQEQQRGHACCTRYAQF